MHLRSKTNVFLNYGFALLLLSVPGLRCALAQVDISSWPTVTMEVRVMGNPVPPLGADSLVLKDGGHVVTVQAMTGVTAPQSVCVLVDASSSVKPQMEAVRGAVATLLRALPPEDEVCLAEFAMQLKVDTPLEKLTDDHGSLGTSLKGLSAGGGTAVYDSLYRLADYMRKSSTNKSRAIVLYSDVDDNYSHAKPDELRKHLMEAGMPVVFVVHARPPAGLDVTLSGRVAGSSKANFIISIGGGVMYFPETMGDLDASGKQIAATLASRYELTYQAANPTKDGRERRVEVGLDKAHAKAKVAVQAPEGYYAPSQ